MRRKVLYVHYVPNPGGAARSLQTLIKYLDRSRFEPHVMLTHKVAEPALSSFQSMGLPTDHFSTSMVWDQPWYSRDNIEYRAFNAFAADRGIDKYLNRVKPDIVHINDFLPIPVGVTAHKMRIPVVWHCRSVLLYRRPVVDPGEKIIDVIVGISKRIVGISEPETEQFRSAKAVTIYNPLEIGELESAKGKGAEVRKKLGIDQGDVVVHAPIPLVEHKGAWDFIEAGGLAVKKAPSVRFRFLITGLIPTPGRRHLLRKWTGFMGPMSSLERAERLASKLGIRDRLMVLGFRKDIYEIMDAADVIVFPSHLKACGRQCFEGGAMGKPVIVTMPEKKTRVVIDGVTGLIVPDRDPEALSDAIVELALDRDRARQMGQNASAHVRENFDAKKHAAAVMDVYSNLPGAD